MAKAFGIEENEFGLWNVFWAGEIVARVNTEIDAARTYRRYEDMARNAIDDLRTEFELARKEADRDG